MIDAAQSWPRGDCGVVAGSHSRRSRFPAFHDAIRRGRDDADGRIAAALFKRAEGYDIEQSRVTKAGELVTFSQHIPGDFNAMSLILRNRQAGRWRERTEVVHDISDRVADRLEAARLRMLGELRAPMIDATPADNQSAIPERKP